MSGQRSSDKRKVRILLAEPEPGEARLYARDIAAQDPMYEFASAATLREMLTNLKEFHPVILLLDLGLPGGAGLEGLRQVQDAAPETLTIILAERAEKELALRAIEQGAVDFLMKGHIDHRGVVRAVQCALWRRETSSSPQSHGLDDLTGLFNRDGFERMAVKHFQQAQKQGGTLVLLRADVDNLAAISQAYGPADGHRVLLAVSQLLQKSFRRSDLVGRTGEEAFAALLIDAVEPSAPILRQRIERRLEALNQLEHRSIAVSLSIGVQFWNPADGGTLEELIRSAEASLQRVRAKRREAQRLLADAPLEPVSAKDSDPTQGGAG